MDLSYDKYYQTRNLFGKPYPELIDFYSKIKDKGKLLDLGCGQGRDAIPLAKLGFDVTGVDNSKVGIDQLNVIAKNEKLALVGLVVDIYTFTDFDKFDHILLDSMFHFGKKERDKEISFLNRLMNAAKLNTVINICIQNVGDKLRILHVILSERTDYRLVSNTKLLYTYVDKASSHRSETEYEMVVIKKTK